MICLQEELPEKREVWYICSGMGSQWAGMGRELMAIDIFSRSIHKSASILAAEGVDLLNILNSPDESIFENVLNSFISIASVQVSTDSYGYNMWS